MSRLDSFIRRLEAQRACLDLAAQPAMIPPGPIFELGLGNGRTYDHLRTRFPDREIFVFERSVAAHPDCIPDAEHLVLGDVVETLPPLVLRFRRRIAFVHYDLGCGIETDNAALAQRLAPLFAEALAPGGMVASDQKLVVAGWQSTELPAGVAAGRYFLYRKPWA